MAARRRAKKTRTVLTQHLVTQIKKQLRAGKTQAGIAAALGVSQAVVSRRAKDGQLKKRGAKGAKVTGRQLRGLKGIVESGRCVSVNEVRASTKSRGLKKLGDTKLRALIKQTGAVHAAPSTGPQHDENDEKERKDWCVANKRRRFAQMVHVDYGGCRLAQSKSAREKELATHSTKAWRLRQKRPTKQKKVRGKDMKTGNKQLKFLHSGSQRQGNKLKTCLTFLPGTEKPDNIINGDNVARDMKLMLPKHGFKKGGRICVLSDGDGSIRKGMRAIQKLKGYERVEHLTLPTASPDMSLFDARCARQLKRRMKDFMATARNKRFTVKQWKAQLQKANKQSEKVVGDDILTGWGKRLGTIEKQDGKFLDD